MIFSVRAGCTSHLQRRRRAGAAAQSGPQQSPNSKSTGCKHMRRPCLLCVVPPPAASPCKSLRPPQSPAGEQHSTPCSCQHTVHTEPELACVAKSPLPLPPPASGRTSSAHPPRLTACKGNINTKNRVVQHISTLSTPQRACLPERSMLLEEARWAETTAPLLAHPTAQQPSKLCSSPAAALPSSGLQCSGPKLRHCVFMRGPRINAEARSPRPSR